MTPTHKGSCLCRTVRFVVHGPVRDACHCHCPTCRKAHGAGVVTWWNTRPDQIEFVEGEDAVTWYHTDTDADRGFCSRCGSSLFFTSPRWPGDLDVALAAIDDPPVREPIRHVFADRAPEWLPVAGAGQRFGGEDGTTALE